MSAPDQNGWFLIPAEVDTSAEPFDGGDVLIGAWYDCGVWNTEIAQFRHYANGRRWSVPVGQTGKPTHYQPMPAPPVSP